MASDGTLTFDTSLNTDGLQKSTSSLGDVAKNALGVFAGNLMTKATEAVINLGKEALNSGMSFEASMAKTKTLFSGTDAQFKELNDTILQISSSTGLAADGLAEAAYSAESAGVSTEMLGTMLENSAKLASAGFTDVDTALSATAKTMNAYGMEGEEAMLKVQKVLIQTQNDGITTVGELGASLAQVTPTAAAFGVSFEQVGASLAVMTAAGTPTAQATTQLNSLIAELGKNGTVAAKNLEKAAEGTKYAGMSFNEMMDSGATLDEVLGMISAEADKSGLSMVDMFSSIEAGKAALSIFSEDGETFRKDLADMATGADVVGEAYATVSDTLEYKAGKIKASMTNIATSLFSMAAGPLADAADAAADALGAIQAGFNENGLAGVADAIMGMMDKAADAIANFDWSGLGDKIVNGINKFIEGDGTGQFLSTAGKVLSSVASGIATLLPKILPAIVKLVSYMITSLYQHIPDFLAAGGKLLLGIANGVIQALPALVEGLKNIYEAWKNCWSEILTALGDWCGKIIDKIVEWAGSMLEKASTGMSNMLTAIIDWVKQLPGKVWTWLVNTVTKLVQWRQNMINTASEAMSNMLSKVVEWVSQLPGKVWTWLVNTVTKLITWGQNMVSNASTAMSNMLTKIIEWVSQLPDKVWTWLVNTVTKVVTWGQNMVSNASTAMSNMLTKIVDWVKQTPDKVWTWLVNTANKVVTWGTNMVSNASTAMSNMINKIVEWAKQIPDKVWTWLSNTAQKVVTWGSDLATKGAAAAKGLFDACVNGIKDLPEKFKSIGSDIVTGIWNGISGGWDWLKNKVKDLAGSLLDAAKEKLGINSPSTEFRDEVGHWLPPGISEGFEDATPDAIKQMEEQAAKMVARMQGAVSTNLGGFNFTMGGAAGLRALTSAGAVVNVDNSFEQHNTYNTPVTSPSEVAKAQREALRKMAGGVK